MIRKASMKDIDEVEKIYLNIHEQEQKGNLTIGWLPGVYPVRDTALKALERDDLFVLEEDGAVKASAIINRIQVPVYADGTWKIPASDDQIMVLHTLVVEPKESGKGSGRAFVEYYEKYARENGCTALRMDTNERNAAARKFYAGQGYWEVGIVPCEFNGIPDVNLVLIEKGVEESN